MAGTANHLHGIGQTQRIEGRIPRQALDSLSLTHTMASIIALRKEVMRATDTGLRTGRSIHVKGGQS